MGDIEILKLVGGWILTFCGGFSIVAVAVGHVCKIIIAARAPRKELLQRVHDIEETLEKHSQYLANDKTRLDAHDVSTRLTLRALDALLAHSIDGNDIASLHTAKDALHDFLINRQ